MTVSFTGHRDACSPEMRYKLLDTIEDMINRGADAFCTGGAVGFDTVAADCVLELQESYPWISLRLVLPCPPEVQSQRFPADAKQKYYEILKAADATETVSPYYTDDCMKRRNQRLIELADVCICCYDPSRYASGTGQTVRMAEKKGIEVINLYDIY